MEKITYQISSRAAILLGRESVSKVDGAIIELIKNTYDADASLCILAFDTENDAIFIIDNGIGMTRDTIQNYWMLIGTDNKKVEYQSKKNRIKSGEKGIGRFALDRLGEICEMYTKHEESNKTIYWKTNWKNFEESGKVINEIAADLDYLDKDIRLYIPSYIVKSIDNVNESILDNFKTGTILKISKLRDKWTNKSIEKIINMLSYVMPNNNSQDYNLYAISSIGSEVSLIENEMINDFDYKLKSDFDGEKFIIEMWRNEFDISKIPDDIFDLKEFSNYPYQKKDFENGIIHLELSIEEIINSSDTNIVETVKNIGPFAFEYVFLKANTTEDYKELYYYKETSNKRRAWLAKNAGIRLYRDNFIIRPYGDINSDSFDWINLDARKASSPAGLSHPNGNWRVRNNQGYGSVFISRVYNSKILDKSSREGIIDNEYFTMFKKILADIIGVFEKDRQYIARQFKKYNDKMNDNENKKEEGRKLAKKLVKSNNNSKSPKQNFDEQTEESFNKNNGPNDNSKLAEALLLIDQEKEELLTELKLLRSLATNGLVTTSIVHDLSGLNSELKKRADRFRYIITKGDTRMINNYLEDLNRNDLFLNSWINVVITQLKQDKRKRKLTDIYLTIKNLELIILPLLEQKNIKINIIGEKSTTLKKIFTIDIESIICNLIINSIEAFKNTNQENRDIYIEITNIDEYIKINYKDNGPGISKEYENPYDIFNFGVTNKIDKNTGEIIGTGLGMYIVATTINEYNGKYNLVNNEDGFEIEILLPQERKENGNI